MKVMRRSQTTARLLTHFMDFFSQWSYSKKFGGQVQTKFPIRLHLFCNIPETFLVSALNQYIYIDKPQEARDSRTGSCKKTYQPKNRQQRPSRQKGTPPVPQWEANHSKKSVSEEISSPMYKLNIDIKFMHLPRRCFE